MEAASSQHKHANRNALVPEVLLIGTGSIVCSFTSSNCEGMALAIIALLVSQFALRNVSWSVWIWCVTLATTGFALGLAALLMRIFIDVLRQ